MRMVGAVVISMLLVVGACATAPKTIAVDSAGLSSFKGRTLKSVTQKAPILVPMRASNAMFGMLGSLAEVDAGKTYAQKHGIVDPASGIEDQLTALLQNRYGMQASTERLDMTTATENTPYPTAPDVLYVDAKTYYWMQSYFSADWGRFRFNYSTLIQLVDGATGRAVAQYDCRKVAPEKPQGAPTLAEMEANNGAVANSLLKGMADTCLSEFEAKVLGMPAAPPA